MPPEPLLPSVLIQTPDGARHLLRSGDLIGRGAAAALRLADARVSEAHAMISLRGSQFHMLALRGMLMVDGEVLDEVVLEPGREVLLAPRYPLTVCALRLPGRVLAVLLPGEVAAPLTRGVYSLLAEGAALRLAAERHPEARGWLWCDEGGWHLQQGEGPSVPARAGDRLPLGEHTLSFVEVDTTGTPPTARGFDLPLVFHMGVSRVEITQGPRAVSLTGVLARLVQALVEHRDEARPWARLAAEVYPRLRPRLTDDPARRKDREAELRGPWDHARSRLKARLQEAGVERDVVRLESGLVQLNWREGDRILWGDDDPS